MIETQQAILLENKFIERLRENLHVLSGTSNITEKDSLSHLRELSGGKMLRNELEAKYPLGRSLEVRLEVKKGFFSPRRTVVVQGQTVLRLKKYVHEAGDVQSISKVELGKILHEKAEAASKNKYDCALGLFSPTGWEVEAIDYIKNEPPGSGWASSNVWPVLIGPLTTELVWDHSSKNVQPYVASFAGLTKAERQQICTEQLEKDLLVQDFASIEKIARQNGFDPSFVETVARKVAKGKSNLKLAKVRDVGMVLKKTI